MLDVRYSTQFKKDFKVCIKRRYKIALLQQVIDTLRIPATLPASNKDHKLAVIIPVTENAAFPRTGCLYTNKRTQN